MTKQEEALYKQLVAQAEIIRAKIQKTEEQLLSEKKELQKLEDKFSDYIKHFI